MARVPYLQKSDLAAADQDLLARDITLHRALAHSPKGARAFLGLGRFIRHESRLDPRLRELAILQVGYLARSPYEYSHHIKIGREFGVTDADIRAMIEETEGRPTGLDAPAKLVLKAAREMTSELAVSDASFEALRRHFDPERLVDLVMTIAFYCGVVRLLASLQIDVEDDYRRYLEDYPLPARP
ncbi:MAG TPA: carboxymuconolactone decarboxylase family protein [Stellaceae bacterium]|nr:carboxymuconolactone decarboxylase family protein [Stellaceae bacterium]